MIATWPDLRARLARRAGRPAGRAVEDPPPAPRESGEALLRRLHWTVLRPLASRLGGDERSLLRGPGIELSEVREYQPGDDVRRIDWNITARADGPYVRESLAERAVDAWLLLDLSASLDWGTARCLKRDRLAEFAGVAGALLGHRGGRVGALLFAERPLQVVPPGAGRAHLLRLLARLRQGPTHATGGRTDLAAALAHAEAVLRRRSLAIVVSDFLVPDGWQAPLRRLARRHEVVAVRLHDPREAALPDVGIVALEDPETGQRLIVDTADRRLRERFARAAAEQARRIQADLAACGAGVLMLGTDEDLLPPLVGFLQARHHRRLGRGWGPGGGAGPTSPPRT